MKVVNQVLLAVLAILSLAACGQQEIHVNDNAPSEVTAGDSELFSQSTEDYIYEPNSIYGLWRSNKMQIQSSTGSYQYSLRVSISNNQIMVAAMCEFQNGEVVVAETNSTIRVIRGQIEVLEDANDLSTSSNGQDCEAKVLQTDSRDSRPIYVESGIMRYLSALGPDVILVKIGN